jgi:hypothetical protein
MTLSFVGLFFVGREHDFLQGFLLGLQATLMVVFLWKGVPVLRRRLRESARQASSGAD